MCKKCVQQDAVNEALMKRAKDEQALMVVERVEEDQLVFMIVEPDAVNTIAAISRRALVHDEQLRKDVFQAVEGHLKRAVARAGVEIIKEKREDIRVDVPPVRVDPVRSGGSGH